MLFLMLWMADAAPMAGDAASFRLETLDAGKKCNASREGDIIVCARRSDRDRLAASKVVAPSGPPPLTLKLPGDAKAHAGLQGGNVGGFTTNRAMIELTIPF